MSKLQRRIYCALLRLHPAAFRHQFGRDMARDCEDALRERGFAPLLGDALLSLARQWKVRALAGPEPVPATEVVAGHPFLSGRYAVVTHSPSLTAFDLVSASALSILLVLTIGYAASVPNRRALADLQTVIVSHDGGLDTGANPPPTAAAGHREAASPLDFVASGNGTPHYKGVVRLSRALGPSVWGQRASGGPPATEPLASALRQLAMISIIVWFTSLLLRRVPGTGRRVAVAALGLLSIAASVAFGQVVHSTDPMPSFEVTTVKPWDGTGFGLPLSSYILQSFNLPPSSVTRLIGPEWIGKTAYVIQAKPADTLRDAMQKMPADQRRQQTQLMQQSLLADRFKLKVHFETREMPVYELVIAKGGPKLKENADPSKGSARIGRNGQMSELKGIALPVPIFIGMLMSGAEIDGEPVIDKTGLPGSYDVLLDWLPSRLPAPPQPGMLMQPGTFGAAPPPEAEGPSLFTALEEQLGLKLVPAKGPVEVVVIDHIEKPSEN